jgi:hypothetical protein
LPRVEGISLLDDFPFASVALVQGAPAALDALGRAPGVAAVYPEEHLQLNLDRVRAAVHADPPTPGDPSWPTGRGVAIALVDSGLDVAHPGFAGRIAADVKIARDGEVGPGGGDADGHGTHVAGILAGDGAMSQNGRLHGLAPGASLVGIDISDSFTTTSAVRAFQWIHDHRAQYGIRVVSNSWGREKTDARYDPDDPVTRAADALVADGLVVVFSAGNRGRDGSATLTTEASDPRVITVGASTLSGRVESYSSRGPALGADGKAVAWVKPDLVAPGTAVFSARTSAKAPAQPASDEDRYYWIMNGTSMAAPQAAATAAMILQQHPTLTPAAIQAILQESAQGAASPSADAGYGMLDVAAALKAADSLQEGERTLVVETRLPVHETGHLVAGAGRVLLLGDAPQAGAPDGVAIPIDVPDGGAEVDLSFTWNGTGSFAAELDAPDGAAYAFASAGGGALSLAHGVAPGAYTLVARPQGPAGDADYAVDGDVVVRETRVVDQPAELTAREPGAGAPADAFDVHEPLPARVADTMEAKPAMVLTSLVLVACAAAVGGLRRR